jgi:Leucine-rich repeat (LRR) protein
VATVELLFLQGLAKLAGSDLELLSLAGLAIADLGHFPSLPKLSRLYLSDNRVSDGLEALVAAAPNLTELDLSGNRIKSLQALQPLAQLKLTALDIESTPLATAAQFDKQQVFKMLATLQYLNNEDLFGKGKAVDACLKWCT